MYFFVCESTGPESVTVELRKCFGYLSRGHMVAGFYLRLANSSNDLLDRLRSLFTGHESSFASEACSTSEFIKSRRSSMLRPLGRPSGCC